MADEHTQTPTERAITTLDVAQKIWMFARTTGAIIVAVAVVGWSAAGYVYGSRASSTKIENRIESMDVNGTARLKEFEAEQKALWSEMDKRWQKIELSLARIEGSVSK